jgi:chromosome segregation ATPase
MGNEPATKTDLADLRAELKQDADQLRSELRESANQLRSEFHHGFDDLKETMRDIQTEILKAFYGFAETNQARLAEIETESAAVKRRLGALESRVLEVEKRLNMPPEA